MEKIKEYSKKLNVNIIDNLQEEFKNKLNSIGNLKIIDNLEESPFLSKSRYIDSELIGYCEYRILKDTLEIKYIETLNCIFSDDFEFTSFTQKFGHIKGLGKYLIIELIEQAKKLNKDKILFTTILSSAEGFYEKISKEFLDNNIIKEVIYENKEDDFLDLIKNITFKL